MRRYELMVEQKEPNKPNKSTGYEALVLITQLGLTLATPIVLGAVAGHWIDSKLGTNMIFLVILVVLGVAAGIMGAYSQITSVVKKKK